MKNISFGYGTLFNLKLIRECKAFVLCARATVILVELIKEKI